MFSQRLEFSIHIAIPPQFFIFYTCYYTPFLQEITTRVSITRCVGIFSLKHTLLLARRSLETYTYDFTWRIQTQNTCP